MSAINKTTVLLCAVLIGAGAATKAADSDTTQAPRKLPVVRAAQDTIWVEFGGQRLPAVLKGLARFDTTSFQADMTVAVIGAQDTLVVRSSEMPFTFVIVSGADTIFETFVIPKETGRPSENAKLDLLRRFNKFGSTVPPGLPVFTYKDKSDSLLSLMREEFKLDSIAGSGDEITRAIRLMHWLHRSVKWDGNKENPDVASNHEMLKVCTRHGVTANCGGVAGMLNEALLAEGFKSRQLVCRPYDTTDQDCHSVNIVYLDSKQKWVLIDPTNDTYFQNVHGEYLGPHEVRQAMIDGDSLVVPDSINVNGERGSKTWYLNYMAKNLFRFSCWATPSRGATNKIRWRQVFLSSSGYQPDRVGTIDSVSKWDIQMYTDDSSVFWRKPQ
jgi:hypothetical protein